MRPFHYRGEAAGNGKPASPMVAQYQALKARHADALLFFRMGDFYELFFDDAVAAAPALEIALTRRGRHGDEDIPMCGVPAHNAELYLHRLIRKGFKVAICEQMEAPAEAKKRGGKALVRRDVVRIVTAGTLTEDGLLDAGRNNFLLAIAEVQAALGLAYVDISTGSFTTEPCPADGLAAALARLAPGEILATAALSGSTVLAEQAVAGVTITRLPDPAIDSVRGERRLAAAFSLATVEALGAFGRAELAAAGAVFDYLELTQKGLLPRLERPRRQEPGDVLQIDAATRRNLELTQGLGGGRAGSLLACIDRTVTAGGGRLLARQLAEPLTELAAIRGRLDRVQHLVGEPGCRAEVYSALRGSPDMERALARVDLGRGGPRDLAAIGHGLRCGAQLRDRLADAVPLADVAARLDPPQDLVRLIETTLVDQPPLLARDGGFIRPGADPALDAQRQLRDQGRSHIVALEERYRRASGIATLKIRHNNLIGWFIEVPATQRARAPDGFVQRQSMAGAVRYTSADLADLEARLAEARERALALELELFDELRARTLAHAEAIRRVAAALAEVDVAASLADLAAERRWSRPLVEDGAGLDIVGGRHPVVEEALARAGKAFVANDCALPEERSLWLLTGPNMAGKSTFLRQNALIAILAQAGSFVPATSARIGTVDRLFSRVGAGDDLARGRSTFMVEMVETAAILNQATARSLVILDEIGRGTATYDGLSLAWAVVEHLHEANRCRALFATHYHELTALTAKLPRLASHTLRVKEWQGDVVFLHEVAPGTADRSYGVHVARLAGLPAAVVARAEEVLKRLESSDTRPATARLADDLPLFAAAAASPAPPPPANPVLEALAETDPDHMSPKAALELIYRLKALLASPASTL